MNRPPDIRDKLIVGLDVATVEHAGRLVAELGEIVTFYKIGYQLVFSGGLDLALDLKSRGKQVFLDMKLLDIDNTVAKAAENVARMGVDMLTIHAYPGAMRAAVRAVQGSTLCLLGVTVLTSMDESDLHDAGYHQSPRSLAIKRAAQAKSAGMGGIVASAQEAHSIRAVIGEEMALVTPGIRPKGAAKGDQKRVMTPADALAAGASHLVVARPVVAAENPCQAAEAILSEMAM